MCTTTNWSLIALYYNYFCYFCLFVGILIYSQHLHRNLFLHPWLFHELFAQNMTQMYVLRLLLFAFFHFNAYLNYYNLYFNLSVISNYVSFAENTCSLSHDRPDGSYFFYFLLSLPLMRSICFDYLFYFFDFIFGNYLFGFNFFPFYRYTTSNVRFCSFYPLCFHLHLSTKLFCFVFNWLESSL